MATFAVEDAQSARVIGSVGLRLSDPGHGVGEVGYWVSKEARGRGVASRAVRLVSAWALVDCGLARLQLRADDRNIPSQRVADKVGFTREGLRRSIRYNARLRRRPHYAMDWLRPDEP